MRFLIMPDSFKESLTASQAAAAIQKGLKEIYPEAVCDLRPVGDGGEGTLDALAQSIPLTEHYCEVTGWQNQPVQLRYLTFADAAFVEMADLVGLEKIPLAKRQPLKIPTTGLGELLLYLEEKKIKKIYIGIGGSGTVDGGIGLAAGLGYQFFNEQQEKIQPLGENLAKVATVDASQVPKLTAKIFAVNDVTNSLCGPNGASYIFGPQKGLLPEELATTDQALKSFYQKVQPEILELIGGGAGGGLAAGLAAFAGAEIISGIDFILDQLNFEELAAKADYIIVGEGRMDGQSIAGKAPIGIASRAPESTIVVGLCGSLGTDSLDFNRYGIAAVFPIIGQVGDLAETLEKAEINLRRTAMNVASLIKQTRSAIDDKI